MILCSVVADRATLSGWSSPLVSGARAVMPSSAPAIFAPLLTATRRCKCDWMFSRMQHFLPAMSDRSLLCTSVIAEVQIAIGLIGPSMTLKHADSADVD
jgi:hypothetical protein